MQVCGAAQASMCQGDSGVPPPARGQGTKMPSDLVSDWGPQFSSRFWKAFCRLMGTSVSHSSGFHPESNGQTERVNQDLAQTLQSLTSTNPSSWVEHLPWAEYAHNTLWHSFLGMSPFDCQFGFPPPMFPEEEHEVGVPAAEQFMQHCRRAWQKDCASLLTTTEARKHGADQRRRPAPTFRPGQWVWLSAKDLPLYVESKKLAPIYVGPFKKTSPKNQQRSNHRTILKGMTRQPNKQSTKARERTMRALAWATSSWELDSPDTASGESFTRAMRTTFHNTSGGREAAPHLLALSQGHPGVIRTLDFLCRLFWWPSIERNIHAFVMSCEMCARCKASWSWLQGLLHPLPVPTQPWSFVSLDFVTSLPPSRGNTVILVLVDRFSKACKFVALPKLPCAKETVELLLQHMVRVHKMPSNLVSDRGSQFSSRFWKAFCWLMGPSVSHSSGFHPESNSQTERINQDLAQTLQSLTSTNPSSWVEHLPWAEYAHNTLWHSSLGMLPFECQGGFPPPMFPEEESEVRVPAAEQFVQHCRRAWQKARASLLKTTEARKQVAD
ncbi:hypothetical protein MHYP_G00048800 [Metynnis hypsauchen]